MLERRNGTDGWVVVGLALVALIGFTGLLYARGGSGPPIALSGAVGTAVPSAPPRTAAPSASPRPSGSSPARSAAPFPAATEPSPSPAGSAGPSPSLDAASPAATASAGTRTPRPSASAGAADSASPSVGASASGLPTSPQPATVALGIGLGDCANAPPGGEAFETTFTLTASGRLTIVSPSNHKLSGRLQAGGSFSVSGTNPVERWVGTLTDTGGSGSYFAVIGDCTEGYETTIAFHP